MAVPGGLPTKQQLDAVVPDRPAVMVLLRRSHLLGQLARAGARGDHGGHARSRRRRDREGPEDRRADRCAEGKRAGPGAKGRAGVDARRPVEGGARGVALAHRFGVTSVQNADASAEDMALFDELRRSGELRLRLYSAMSVEPGFARRRRRLDGRRKSTATIRSEDRRGQAAHRRGDRVAHGGDAGALREQGDKRPPQLHPRGVRARHRDARPARLAGLDRTRSATAPSGCRSTRSSRRPPSTPHPRAAAATAWSTSRRSTPPTSRASAGWGSSPCSSRSTATSPTQLDVWKPNIGPARRREGGRSGAFSTRAAGSRSAPTGRWCLDPRSAFNMAINRTTLEGTPAGGWLPEQRIPMTAAIDAYTSGAGLRLVRRATQGDAGGGHAGRHHHPVGRHLLHAAGTFPGCEGGDDDLRREGCLRHGSSRKVASASGQCARVHD